MTLPLISTKLSPPPQHADWVTRPRLLSQLDQAITSSHNLIIVSAPAGSGKTVLISQWIAQFDVNDPAVAWLTLDNVDSDPTRFLKYLIAALQTAYPSLGETLQGWLHSPKPLSCKSALAMLFNEINAFSKPILLILDDYHVIEHGDIHASLADLLDYLPYNLYLIIITREKLPFSITRLYLHRRMTGIYATDLRFTIAEVKRFFSEIARLDLPVDHVIKLAERTEGWIAGLQLAALSLQHVKDTAVFVDEFSGQTKAVVDYIIAEVLQRQPAPIQKFLLQTSILEQFTADLCSMVTEQDDGHQIIKQLVANNLFLISLDHRQEWYRYHYLFGEALRYQLKTLAPDNGSRESASVKALHHRAAMWYEAHNLVEEALHHFLAAKEFDNAGKLLEAQIPAVFRRGDAQTIRRWLTLAPPPVVEDSPRLLLYSIWIYSLFDQHQEMAAAVERAQVHLPAIDTRNETTHAIDWQTELDLQKAWVLYGQGEIEAATKLCRAALKQIPAGNHILLGVAHNFLGCFAIRRGNLDDAHKYIQLATKYMWQAGSVIGVITAAVEQAKLHVARGEQQEALATFQRRLTWIENNERQGTPRVGSLHAEYGKFLYALSRLPEAEAHLKQSIVLNQKLEILNQEYEARLLLRRCQWASGKQYSELTTDTALESLWIKILGLHYPPIDVHRLEVMRVEQWLREGQLARARQWASRLDLSLTSQPDYHHDRAKIAVARLYILAGTELRAAAAFLARLQEATSDAGWVAGAIEIMILQAIVRAKLNQRGQARETLQKALILSEWTGFTQPFIDEGQRIAPLLSQTDHPLSRTLLHQMGHNPLHSIDPLSERELEVLNLYAAGFNRTEIAEQLTVSKNAVKWHLKNVYSKLGVHRRADAVARAEALGLLS